MRRPDTRRFSLGVRVLAVGERMVHRMSALFKNLQLVALLLAVLVGGLATSQVLAQVILPGIGDSKKAEQGYNGVFLPSDRTLSRGVQQARERISAGDFSRAIRFLDELLDPAKEDSFVVIAGSNEVAGLKATSRQILKNLSAEGRQAYESTFGPVARRELRNAIDEGDFDALRRVTQRYFYTPAGYEAVLLLAAQEADMGRHFSAALAYQQLIDTPEAAKLFQPQLSLMAALSWLAMDDRSRALELIEDLREAGYRSVSIAGKDYQLESFGAQPLEWLQQTVGVPLIQAMMPEDQWLTFRGNAARNGQTDGGLPHMRVRWQVRLLSHHRLETLYDDLAAELMRSQKAVPIAATPLAVGDHIITRSAHGLIAIDFRTGKLVWQAEPQGVPEIENLVNSSGSSHEQESQAGRAKSFSTRIWEDQLYSSLSSDGERVYVIRDLSIPTGISHDVLAMPFRNVQRLRDGSAGTNRLCAFDLATQGKRVWEIDGATAEDDFQGAFFLGSPLAVGKSLYCLVEMKSAVYLASLDRETGKPLWRQQLANLEAGILLDPRRRLQASIPSYEGGILICPTGAGVVVGIDLAKKALAWAYRYPTSHRPIRRFRGRNDHRLLIKNQWIDSTATLAEGHVLLTPRESEDLHCLDLMTGKLLWKLPRKEHLFVAGVLQKRVLLVGSKQLTAVRLADGAPAWQEETLELPKNSVPSGRGFFSDGRYYLPLTSAEVIAIDVEQGAIVKRTVARDGQVLGNLVCHRGAVLSQNGQFLDRFDQIDVLRSKSEELLDEDPTNYEALRTLGEIAYNEGDLSQAIELLEKAYESSSEDLRTREVLAESLMIALDEDFSSYRDRLPLLRELQEDSGNGRLTSLRLALLRLESHGLLEVGDLVGSFETCLQLYDESAESSEFLSIGRNHQVEVSRWLQGQVSAIWRKAGESEKELISTRLQQLLDQFPDQPSEEETQRLVDCLGDLVGVEAYAIDLAKEYASAGRLLQAQQLFMRLADSKNEVIRGEAVASCSLTLHQLNLAQLARPFDETLNTTLANVVCLDGKTGKQCLEEWGLGSLSNRLEWPYGKVAVKVGSKQNSAAAQKSLAIRLGIHLEQCDEVLGRGNIMLSPSNGEVTVCDSLGNNFFRASLTPRGRGQRRDANQLYAAARGNLLIVSLGSQIVAYDTLGLSKLDTTELESSELGAAEPLWQKDLVSTLDPHFAQVRGLSGRQNGRPGTFRASRAQRNGKWIGVIGPVTNDSCIYQDQRHLVCVNSLTGEVRWTRSDVPQGCDLYGDEDYVFVVPRSSKTAMVFSTVDGRSLGEVSVPPWREQLATIGRNVIRWRKRADGRNELSSFDSFAGETLWREDFGRNAKVDIALSRYVSIVDQAGNCVIIDAVNGSRLVDQNLPQKPVATDIHLMAGSDSFVLAVQTKKAGLSRGLNPVDYAMIDGLVYAFNRSTGLPAWKRPAEIRNQPLMLSQPVDAPVIAFVGNVSRRNNRGSQKSISMLLLEKASGRVLFQEENLRSSTGNYCSMRASISEDNPSDNEVVIETSGQTVRLKFTDQKRAPEPPAMIDVETKDKKGQKGLLGIGKKLIGGALP